MANYRKKALAALCAGVLIFTAGVVWLPFRPNTTFIALTIAGTPSGPVGPLAFIEADRNALQHGPFFARANNLPSAPCRQLLIAELAALPQRSPHETVILHVAAPALRDETGV